MTKHEAVTTALQVSIEGLAYIRSQLSTTNDKLDTALATGVNYASESSQPLCNDVDDYIGRMDDLLTDMRKTLAGA